MDKTVKRGDLLAQIHQSLALFNDQASQLERWLGEALEIIPDASPTKIEDLIAQKETLKNTLDQVVTNGKVLINHKDVTDTANLRDKIKVGISSVGAWPFFGQSLMFVGCGCRLWSNCGKN